MNRILKATIIEKFETQADFAAAVGDDETMVSRVIRGRRALAPQKQAAWAETLGVPIRKIFRKSGSSAQERKTP